MAPQRYVRTYLERCGRKTTASTPCYFLLLPAELRLLVYRLVFDGFMLQISGESTCAPYNADPQTAQNQVCRTNKQIRVESIPILAWSTKVITAPILLPRKDGRVDPSFKPTMVFPSLHFSFLLSIESISVSLQSTWVPQHFAFPRLKKIAIDGWLYDDAASNQKKADKDLIERTTADLDDLTMPEDIQPRWLWDFNEQCKPRGVKLALQQVWMLDEEKSDTSYLRALVNISDGKIEERQLGPKKFDQVDTIPPAWLFEE